MLIYFRKFFNAPFQQPLNIFFFLTHGYWWAYLRVATAFQMSMGKARDFSRGVRKETRSLGFEPMAYRDMRAVRHRCYALAYTATMPP